MPSNGWGAKLAGAAQGLMGAGGPQIAYGVQQFMPGPMPDVPYMPAAQIGPQDINFAWDARHAPPPGLAPTPFTSGNGIGIGQTIFGGKTQKGLGQVQATSDAAAAAKQEKPGNFWANLQRMLMGLQQAQQVVPQQMQPAWMRQTFPQLGIPTMMR